MEKQKSSFISKEQRRPSQIREWRDKISKSEEKRRRIAEMRHYLERYMEA